MTDNSNSDFFLAFKGGFTSALRWHHLDALWDKVKSDAGSGWYIYALGGEPPDMPSEAARVQQFIEEIDRLLRSEHKEEYCGIVYADDLNNPAFIKIYDPNNLGVSCGYSDNPPLPGWLMTKIRPLRLEQALMTGVRRRWWERIFAS